MIQINLIMFFKFEQYLITDTIRDYLNKYILKSQIIKIQCFSMQLNSFQEKSQPQIHQLPHESTLKMPKMSIYDVQSQFRQLKNDKKLAIAPNIPKKYQSRREILQEIHKRIFKLDLKGCRTQLKNYQEQAYIKKSLTNTFNQKEFQQKFNKNQQQRYLIQKHKTSEQKLYSILKNSVQNKSDFRINSLKPSKMMLNLNKQKFPPTMQSSFAEKEDSHTQNLQKNLIKEAQQNIFGQYNKSNEQNSILFDQQNLCLNLSHFQMDQSLERCSNETEQEITVYQQLIKSLQNFCQEIEGQQSEKFDLPIVEDNVNKEIQVKSKSPQNIVCSQNTGKKNIKQSILGWFLITITLSLLLIQYLGH